MRNFPTILLDRGEGFGAGHIHEKLGTYRIDTLGIDGGVRRDFRNRFAGRFRRRMVHVLLLRVNIN